MDRIGNTPSSSLHHRTVSAADALAQASARDGVIANVSATTPDSSSVLVPDTLSSSSISPQVPAASSSRTRKPRKSTSSTTAAAGPSTPDLTTSPNPPRRSARISSATAASASKDTHSASSSSGNSSKKAHSSVSSPLADTTPTVDRKGKKRAAPEPSDLAPTSSSSKRSKTNSSSNKGKDKAPAKKTKSMPKNTGSKPKKGGPSGSTDRSKKGDSSARHLIDNHMDEDDAHWDEAGGSLIDDDHYHEDEDMEDSDHEEDDEDSFSFGGRGGASAYERLARMADASNLFDEATAAAIFGGDFRGFGGMMSGLSNRLKRLKTDLRSPKAPVRLKALRECSELLLVSNEETLGSSFSTFGFATEFIAILNGKPNIEKDAGNGGDDLDMDEDMDEDAQFAAALAMSAGGYTGGDDQEEMEAQLLACRCLAHLMEALPGSGHALVQLGAVPVLCSKLNEISYIELAEQTLSTMEKISAEYPGAIVREGGLAALLNFLPFFSTNVQRTAVTAAANCCRNISTEHFTMIRDAFPILRDVLTQADQRLVEQATLAVVRTLDSYRHNAEHLEGLLDLPTVVAINALLAPSGGSPLISDATYTHLIKVLTSSARASPKVTVAFLEAGITSTIHQILTGVLPSSHQEEEQGDAPGGQGLGSGIADMAIMQNLARRPKDQVEEILSLICELLPPLPRDGIFDPKGYTERSLAKIKKRGGRPERPKQRSSRSDGSGSSTPAETGTTPTGQSSFGNHVAKAKRDAEQLSEQRLALLKSSPELIGKFIRALVPVLVDVYAASVSLRVRTKSLTGLVKAAAFAEPVDLQLTLTNVPMSSFLGSIISAKDNPTFVLHALQLVELLATKLAIIFLTSFLREGVVYEIEALAEEDLNIKAASEEDTSPTDSPVKVDTVLPITPKATSSSSAAQQITPVTELSSGGFIATYLASGVSASTKHVVSDPNDANILRARVIGAKRVFAVDGSQQNEAALVLSELAALVKRLCVAEATEAELRDTLRVIAAHFSNVDQALSSFELLKSGLVDGLLEYVDIDGAVSSSERRAILYDIFSDTTLASPSPLVMLVKRLHESLGRLENFQVETAFGGMNGVGSSTTSLARSMRIRLQAEDGDDVPKQVSQLSVTIQAIAPVQALHDYLRPRIADPMYLSGNAALQNMFAAYAASRGGGGSAARLLAALTGASGASGSLGGLGGSGAAARLGTSAGAATGSSSTAPEAPATDKKEVKSQRRRSARLNRAGDQGEEEGAPEASSSTAPLSVSAPEPSALSRLSLGMDFDDDYSDEDYDAEVFEEDMDEELLPPTEKVVNMSMAADGSRVEAKTPDGTRIATPNQASTSKTAATATPTRTGSYAGALKSAPTDWHLEFSINGHVLALEDTIYGAVHKMSNRDSAPVNVFNLPVTFKFRKVEGPPPPPKDAPMDAPSPASTSSVLPPGLEPSSEVSKILRLLRVVHNLCVEAHDTACRPDAPYEKLFVNNKLTAKLTRQLEETMILASNCLPDWAVELSQHFSFLFPFETRYNFLRSTSFGYARLISHWQASQPRNNSNGRRDDNLAHLGRLVRQKVRISRAQLLESCAKVLEVYGTSNGVLEVEYFDEIGTGLGPTLEFYSLASKEFARRSLKLWRDEDDSKPGAYVFHSHGLFPAPVLPNEPSIETAGSRLAYFKTLGLFVGRALLDSRIIDLHINKVFLKLLLSKPVKKSISTLKLIDASVARSLERLQSYLQARKEIESLVSLPASSRRAKLAALTINGAKLQDLSLDFTLPGYDIELKPGGRMIDVDDSNLEEYLELVVDKTLGSGVQPMVKAFQEGFSMIFPIQHMQIFSPDEFGLLCGNVDEDWSRETLEQSIKADHGYNSDSRTVKNLIDVMASYTLEERRQFLQFITGAPKLPIGGFRSGLNPPFTVVRKPHEPPIKADQMLPSVMTCAQYLKLPDYSSIEVLHAQLLRATLDGSGSFHLS